VRLPTAAVILNAWERAYGLGLVEKSLVMLSIAYPNEPLARLAEWHIGRRDGALLALRAQLFGDQLRSVESCPQCGDRVEIDLSVQDIHTSASGDDQPIRMETAGGVLLVRRPGTVDLAAVARLATIQERRTALLQRCIQYVPNAGTDNELGPLTEELQTAIAERLAAADPQADVRLALDCSKCGHAWSARFDIVQFLWAEIHTWAQRMMAEVHTLAIGYGWSELDILAMTPWRRQVYLEMLRR
jgi:hypothetical protein